ncbi:hypothetical protein [Aeropyrum camini]|uniref:Adhesin domain-containing protein n=1 Tax=Aeropyrum camini SY1 = JCM 12091 TaxID=1198449 RepID=U3TCL2_9CREN|nr:hypothetical protein [Aeropyrum camini]BAN89693.1 hypothetical protein ACAM_0224 [Aeropyrum camini SY1 = JCM 12091]
MVGGGERVDKMGRASTTPLRGLRSVVRSMLRGIIGRGVAPWSGRRIGFGLEKTLDRDILLIVEADSSEVRITGIQGRSLSIRGFRSPGGNVELGFGEKRGRLIARLRVDSASVTVEAPLEALAVIADSSGVVIEAVDTPLDYVSVKADSSGVKGRSKIKPGGGVYVEADSSGVKLAITPTIRGEYWIDVDSRSSGVTIEFEGDKTYYIEEQVARLSRLEVKKDAGAPGGSRVRVNVKAVSSSVKIV